MRRQDKAKNMRRVNMLFEQRIKEEKLNEFGQVDGEYMGEMGMNDVNEESSESCNYWAPPMVKGKGKLKDAWNMCGKCAKCKAQKTKSDAHWADKK
jgi:hypothetical protein